MYSSNKDLDMNLATTSESRGDVLKTVRIHLQHIHLVLLADQYKVRHDENDVNTWAIDHHR